LTAVECFNRAAKLDPSSEQEYSSLRDDAQLFSGHSTSPYNISALYEKIKESSVRGMTEFVK
jgi:hypothetical protein